jgi:hypothetical protein
MEFENGSPTILKKIEEANLILRKTLTELSNKDPREEKYCKR